MDVTKVSNSVKDIISIWVGDFRKKIAVALVLGGVAIVLSSGGALEIAASAAARVFASQPARENVEATINAFNWVTLAVGVVFVLIGVGFAIYVIRQMKYEGLNSLRRSRDESSLSFVLSYLDLGCMDGFFDSAKHLRITGIGTSMWDCFEEAMRSSRAHFYDHELHEELRAFRDKWEKVFGFREWFTNTPNPSIYRFLKAHESDPQEHEAASEKFMVAVANAEEGWSRLMNFVRDRYPQVDLEETSEKARKFHAAEALQT